MLDHQPDDFTKLDDPSFLTERARLRGLLEDQSANDAGRGELQQRYDAMTAEFCRRARIAWTRYKLGECKPVMDDYTCKRLLAIEVLLEEPNEINDILETELYALRDRLQAVALSPAT